MISFPHGTFILKKILSNTQIREKKDLAKKSVLSLLHAIVEAPLAR